MRTYFSLLFWLFLVTGLRATVADRTYTEADDGVRPDKEIWGKLEQRLYASWASRDILYVKRAVPQLRVKTIAAQNDDGLSRFFIGIGQYFD